MIDDLVQLAKHQPHRVHEAIAEAFRRGKVARSLPPPAPLPTPESAPEEVAKKLRRRALVTGEYDGRAHMLELADELDPLPEMATGDRIGPMSSSESNDGSGQP